MVFYCCIPYCSGKDYSKRVFPLWDIEVYKIWVNRINNPKITLSSDPKEVHKKFRVCDKHFEDICRLPGEKRLKRDSLPTLHLPPGYQRTSEKDALFRFFKSDVESTREGSDEMTVEISSTQTDPAKDPAVPSTSTNTIHIEDSTELPSSSLPQRKYPAVPSTSTSIIQSEDSSKPPSSSTPPIKCAVRSNRRRINLLRGVVSSAKLLCPRENKLYKRLQDMHRYIRKQKASAETIKERLNKAFEMASSPEFVTASVNPVARNFILSQFRHLKKAARGRRFSLEDKVLALAIMRQSHRGYSLLQKVFALPSRQTLNNLLHKIKFEAGINKQILNHLKLSISKMSEKDKVCCLMFDEMSISPSLEYDLKTDTIIGFENDSEGQCTKNFADHALLFMVKGVYRKWKQPIAFMFTEHSTPTQRLVVLIKSVIKELLDIGLNVIATVCDQGTNNVSAINTLLKETHSHFVRQGQENRLQGFLINNMEVIPFYDPPHLLKGIRNNLLTKDAIFTLNGISHKASWSDIIQLYELDKKYDDKKLCYKLTDQHVYKDQIRKMRVCYAAQVFSQRVSAILNFAAECGKLPPSAYGTSEFILFMDKLFDSVNAISTLPSHGKSFRVAVEVNSYHLGFWQEAVQVLKTMKFIDNNGKEVVPPSVTNWIKTIKNFQYLSRQLFTKYEFHYFVPRNINQDPVENFFGSIRNQGARNINPTCYHFITSFKTLLINNFLSPRSAGANCEEDESEGALDNLRSFLLMEPVAESQEEVTFITPEGIEEYSETEDIIARNLDTYLAGFIAKKITNEMSCKKCVSLLREKTADNMNTQLIRKRTYYQGSLCFPSTVFASLFSRCYYYCNSYMPHIVNLPGIKKRLIHILTEKNLNLNILCDKHGNNVVQFVLERIVDFFIVIYIKNIKKILRGRYQMNIHFDFMKRKAQLKYQKSLKRKKLAQDK